MVIKAKVTEPRVTPSCSCCPIDSPPYDTVYIPGSQTADVQDKDLTFWQVSFF